MTNKKFLFIGMAVLLSASLFFLGCGGDDDPVDDDNNNTTSNWYDGLGDVTETNGTVTLAADTELSADLEVPDGKTLTVGAGKTLTVPADKTLTVTGTLNGVGPTSKLVLGAAVTVAGTELAAGTYVWDSNAWTDETAYNTAVATAAAAALVATNGTLNGKAEASGTTVTLNQSEVTIASGTTLNIPANVTLVVPNEKKLSMAGTFNVTGAVEVQSGGKYAFESTGTGTSTGNTTVKNGGEVLSVPGSDMGGTGWTVIETGGKAYSGTDWNTKTAIISVSNDSTFAVIKLTSGSVSTNNYGYMLDGVATVYGRSDAATNAQGTFWVGVVGSGATSAEKNKVLTIKAGGVLTVPGDDASTNKHILGVVTGEGDAEPGVVGEPGNGSDKAAAQIVLQSHGYIDVYGPVPTSSSDYPQTIGNLNHNFYTNGGVKVTANSLCNKTYNWDVDAGSSGVAGWKAGS